jgi:hypothetical protein
MEIIPTHKEIPIVGSPGYHLSQVLQVVSEPSYFDLKNFLLGGGGGRLPIPPESPP